MWESQVVTELSVHVRASSTFIEFLWAYLFACWSVLLFAINHNIGRRGRLKEGRSQDKSGACIWAIAISILLVFGVWGAQILFYASEGQA